MAARTQHQAVIGEPRAAGHLAEFLEAADVARPRVAPPGDRDGDPLAVTAPRGPAS